MGKAGKNESFFKAMIESKFGEILNGKRIWRNDAGVEISVDESIEIEDFDLLIEVDSGNYAKLIVGQYVLLNELYQSTNKKPVFVVIHFYDRDSDKPYNPNRTIKNLKLVNQNMYSNDGIPFLVYNVDTFNKLIDPINTIKELNDVVNKEMENYLNDNLA